MWTSGNINSDVGNMSERNNMLSLLARIHTSLKHTTFDELAKLYPQHLGCFKLRLQSHDLSHVVAQYQKNCHRAISDFDKFMGQQDAGARLQRTNFCAADYMSVGGPDRFWFMHSYAFLGQAPSRTRDLRSKGCTVRGAPTLSAASLPNGLAEAMTFVVAVIDLLHPERYTLNMVPRGDHALPTVFSSVNAVSANMDYPVYHLHNVSDARTIKRLMPYETALRLALPALIAHDKLRRYDPDIWQKARHGMIGKKRRRSD